MAEIDKDKTYRDRLPAYAEIYGFKFLTDSHDAKFGRRLVVHEFPGSDDVVVEELGAKAGHIKLNAYFIGEHYDREINKFLSLLARPEATTLVHPWRGRVWVRAQEWSIHESNKEQGMGTVSVDFVPGGRDAIVATVDMSDTALGSIRDYQAAATQFEPEAMPATSMEAFVTRAQNALEKVRGALALAQLPLTWAAQVQGVFASVKGLMAEVLAVPGEYANALLGLVNAVTFGQLALSELGAADEEATRMRSVRALMREAARPADLTNLGAADTPALRRNLEADALARGHWLTASSMELALADYTSQEAKTETLKLVLAGLDALLPKSSDTLFEAAVQARTHLQEALAAQHLAPTQRMALVRSLPATLLAYQLGVTEEDFLVRNAANPSTRHPLFVTRVVYG